MVHMNYHANTAEHFSTVSVLMRGNTEVNVIGNFRFFWTRMKNMKNHSIKLLLSIESYRTITNIKNNNSKHAH